MSFLESLDHETFAPLAGHVFSIATAGGPLELHLHAVSHLGQGRAEATREPFALVFRGQHGLRLPQGIYRFENASLGEIEMFITQLADDPQGADFEAIFT
jgi:hypothetical protein